VDEFAIANVDADMSNPSSSCCVFEEDQIAYFQFRARNGLANFEQRC